MLERLKGWGTRRTAVTASLPAALRPGLPALCGVAGFLALLVGIAGPSLWLDEASSWAYARQPLDGLLATTTGSTNAVEAAYYVVLHFWMALAGDSELALRLPSAAAMAVGVWATSRTALEAASDSAAAVPGAAARAAVVAGVAMIALPGVTRYGQEARPYAFVVAAIALSTLMLYYGLTRPGRRWWAAYALAVVAVGYFHLLSLLVVPGQFLAMLALARNRWREFGAALAAAALPLLPLALLGLSQRGQIAWIPPIQTEWLWTSPSLITGSLFASACVALLLVLTRGGDRRLLALGLPSAAAIPLLLWTAGHFARLFLSRYLIGAASGVALLLAAALSGMRPIRAAIVGAILIAVVAPQQIALREPAAHNQDFRAAAQLVATDCRARIAYDGQAREAMSYYLARQACSPSEMVAQNGRLWVVQAAGSQVVEEGSTLLRVERFGSATVTYWAPAGP